MDAARPSTGDGTENRGVGRAEVLELEVTLKIRTNETVFGACTGIDCQRVNNIQYIAQFGNGVSGTMNWKSRST